MSIDRAEDLRCPDPEDPSSFERWADFLGRDTREVPPYLRERYEPEQPASPRISAEQFVSRHFHELEQARLWSRTWQMVCRENDIPHIGDYLEHEIAGRSIVVVRSDADQITAMYNSCRHRGAAVVTGRGQVNGCFSCPFHGWTYGLDGSLQHVPAEWDFDLDAVAEGLRRVRVETFDGWVFVNFDETAPSLIDFMGTDVVRHLTTRPMAKMWKAFHLGKVLPCNWKLMVGGFLEGYHLARTHPALTPFIGDLQGQVDVFGYHHRLAIPMLVSSVIAQLTLTEGEIVERFSEFSGGRYGDTEAMDLSSNDPTMEMGAITDARAHVADLVRTQAASMGVDIGDACDSELIDAISYFLFPNLNIFITPVGRAAFRVRPYGDDPSYCIFEWMQFVPLPHDAELPADSPLQMLEESETFSDYKHLLGRFGAVTDEDVRVAVLCQKGLSSSDALQLGRTQEAALINFHHNVSTFVGEG